jgi:two-component system sensor histidine kinase/response regulator
VIVALTAHTGPEQQAECEAAGMDDFLTKPIELARLVQVLEKWQVRLKANPDAAASRAASSPPAPPASSRA